MYCPGKFGNESMTLLLRSRDDGRTTSLYRNWNFQLFSENPFVRKRPITRRLLFKFHLNSRYRCDFSFRFDRYAAVCTSENYVFQTMFFMDFSVFASHSTFSANVQKKLQKSNSYRENFVTVSFMFKNSQNSLALWKFCGFRLVC